QKNNCSQVRESGVGSCPQSGKGAGGGGVPRNRYPSICTGSVMSTLPSSFESEASMQPSVIGAPRNRNPKVLTASVRSKLASPFEFPRWKDWSASKIGKSTRLNSSH